MLIARDPDLEVEEIYEIIKYSAVTDLDWGSIHPENGPYGDYYYGYGRVDAYRAMLAITRGDANNDGRKNVGDAVYLVNYIQKGGTEPAPHLLNGDANSDGLCNYGDIVYMTNYCFKQGPPPQICFEY